jgi:hypothetical protein
VNVSSRVSGRSCSWRFFFDGVVGTGSTGVPGAVSAVVGSRAASSCLDLPLSAVTGPGVLKVFRRKGWGCLPGSVRYMRIYF